MQSEKAMRLAREWRGKGSPPCAHPEVVTEFYLGSRTGDMVCTTCGADFPKGDEPRDCIVPGCSNPGRMVLVKSEAHLPFDYSERRCADHSPSS